MHKLDRESEPPSGLQRLKQGVNSWSDVTPELRDSIWERLNAMQGHRCAYCEATLRTTKRHIDHFKQRRSYPQGTFEWGNLFGSCNRASSCGYGKDRSGAYLANDLIKPDEDNPEAYLLFLPSGVVHSRAGLNSRDSRRAEETIRILGLNGDLSEIRRRAVGPYLETAEAFMQMSEEYEVEKWLPLLKEELRAVVDLPFATAIRHVLTQSMVR